MGSGTFRKEKETKSLHYTLSRCYSSVVITFSGFPQHWMIIFYQFGNLLDDRVQKLRRLVVLTVKFNYNLTIKVTNNSTAPCGNSQHYWANVGEFLRPCWRWCAKGCNNFQQCGDLQQSVGRIQPIRICKPCVLLVRGPNNVGRTVKTDQILLYHATVITEQDKFWELFALSLTSFKLCATNLTCNNMQQGVQTNGFNM